MTPSPDQEQQRLEDLYSYNILDTGAERDFDELVQLANMICGTDMSLVSLVDKGRQWFKARTGISLSETPRNESICAHAISEDGLFIVENTLQDQRFSSLPSVVNDPNVRFYAGAPIVSSNGFKLGTVCVLDDKPRQLNEMQKQALEKLARQASLLMEFRKKNEQLKRIAREQLQLKQLAEVAAKSQRRFLANTSHELRTPLNAIIGMTELLLAENPAPHQLEHLEALRFASGNMLHVVNDLLDYSKIVSNSLTFEQIDFHLPQLLQHIIRTHAVAARNKNLRLELSIEASVPEQVNGDPLRLTQILHNLLGNALKFTGEGLVRLSVSLADTKPEIWSVHFMVEDTGIGIGEDRLGAIFEEFGQAHSGITRQFGGTGLGLAITRRLLELQGSEIFVRSQPGAGSCFYFTLALRKPGSLLQTASCSTDEGLRFAGRRARVVEDNPLNWLVLRKYLEGWNMEAHHAENGAKALELCCRNTYDVVFMDLQMPVMDGYEATRRLRGEVGFEGPLFAITADAFAGSDQDLKSLGFTGSVVKPFDRSELCTRLTAVLRPFC